MMTNEEMMAEMLAIQNSVNSNVDVNWKNLNREWYRASWIETAELMDSLDWRWWKNQEDDLDNARIEAVDIWHFILAKCIECNVTAEVIRSHWSLNVTNEGRLIAIDRLAFTLLKMKFEGGSIISVIEVFSQVCNHLNLSIKEIYIFYIGKATLNNFRQNNGYKEGTYVKEWPRYKQDGSQEIEELQDNVYLTEILEGYLGEETLPDNLQFIIYSKLEELYKNKDLDKSFWPNGLSITT